MGPQVGGEKIAEMDVPRGAQTKRMGVPLPRIKGIGESERFPLTQE
jgi:hypothetical protein